MSTKFPRQRDRKGHAWGLRGSSPKAVWERFSNAYEKQLEFIVHVLEQRGFVVDISGAGGEDGEYVYAIHKDGRSLFLHLEDPREARKLSMKIHDGKIDDWLNSEFDS